VHRVLPGIQAAFVSIGLDKDAFLYVEDVAPHPSEFEAEPGGAVAAGSEVASVERPRIDDLVKEG
jgi:Ribonuclease G/E